MQGVGVLRYFEILYRRASVDRDHSRTAALGGKSFTSIYMSTTAIFLRVHTISPIDLCNHRHSRSVKQSRAA
jgi:hypothetical protein